MENRDHELRNIGALEAANKIYEIGLLANQSTDLTEVFRAIVGRIASETGASYAGISLVDRKRQLIVHKECVLREGKPPPEGHTQAIGVGVVGQVVATGRPYSLPDISLFSDYISLVEGMRSELAVPLKLGGEVIGVVNVESKELGKFGATTQAVLQALASPIAQAIRSAQLFHAERLRRKQLGLLNQVSSIINATHTLDELLLRACRSIRERLGYGLVAICMVDEKRKNITLAAVATEGPNEVSVGYSQSLGTGVVGEVAVTGASMLVPDVRQRSNYVSVNDQMLSEMCCPLKSRGKVIGCLDAENAAAGSFDGQDLMLLETIAEHLSQAIANRWTLERISQLKNDLTSMIVHDLRSPVTVIQSTLQLLAAQSRKKTSAPQEENPAPYRPRRDPRSYIQHAQRSCDEMLVLIDSLLELQKLESGDLQLNPSRCAPGDMPRRVAARLAIVAESREITLEAASSDDLPSALLDLDLVSRVLQNLVSNALKFTPPKGRVTVMAAVAPESLLTQRLPSAKRGLLFTVRDTGPGIPEDEQERIFEKFGVVESRRSGVKVSTGLGLAFCKQAVNAHRGEVWVENLAEGGSAFYVLLPLEP
jgi:signal transduction histidine kinase